MASGGGALRWSAAREAEQELLDFDLGQLGRFPAMVPFAASGLNSPLDLLEGPGDEARALSGVALLGKVADPRGVLIQLLGAGFSDRVNGAACAYAAHAGWERRDWELVELALERLAALTADPFNRMDRVWSKEPGSQDLVVTADIACLAVRAAWRALYAMERKAPAPFEVSGRSEIMHAKLRPELAARAWQSDTGNGIAVAIFVGDYLLDRCGVPQGAPGHRVEVAGALLVHGEPRKIGRCREREWRAALRAAAEGAAAPARVLRDYACWHAGALHNVAEVARLALGREQAIRHGSNAYRTVRTSTAGLFERARLVLARHSVWDASWTADAGDQSGALALLRRARRLAPASPTIRAIYEEARARST